MAATHHGAHQRASATARICAVLALLAGILAAFATQANAVHDDGDFELDGNALNQAADGHDWETVFANENDDCAGIAGSTTIAACAFASDPKGDGIFTGGGSKDEQEISSWRHTDGNVPDKDEILDAYAVLYDDGNLYFGADRFATNGDAQIGFWFFHDEISLNSDGTFSGVHTAHEVNDPDDLTDDEHGDILVLSNFTNGGSVPNIRVFEWYGVNDVRIFPGVPENSLCSLAQPNDAACAITSGDPDANSTSPWDYQAKGNNVPADTFINGSFYEGGIDLNFLGLGQECFASFLAETRSSTSITATLKDFALGGFGDCGTTVTTQVSSTSVSIGTGSVNVSDTATVTGTGALNPPDPTGTVDFYLCGPTPDITSCSTSGTLVANDVALSSGNPATASSGNVAITEVGDYCFFAQYSGDDNYDPDGDDGTNECFTVTPAQPTITTSATAGPVDLGQSISDTATLSGTATDPDGNAAAGTITFNAYGPDDANCTGAAVYTNTVNVTGDGNYGSGSFTPTSPGVYRWIASYSGDSPNTLGVSGACNDANESTTVRQAQPTLTTAQSWVPQDSMTVSVSFGGALAGTAHFELYASTDCSGTAVYSQNVALSGASPQTVSTSNDGTGPDGYTATASNDYSWKVSYTSTNTAHAGIAATCHEVSSLTIDNDNTD